MCLSHTFLSFVTHASSSGPGSQAKRTKNTSHMFGLHRQCPALDAYTEACPGGRPSKFRPANPQQKHICPMPVLGPRSEQRKRGPAVASTACNTSAHAILAYCRRCPSHSLSPSEPLGIVTCVITTSDTRGRRSGTFAAESLACEGNAKKERTPPTAAKTTEQRLCVSPGSE